MGATRIQVEARGAARRCAVWLVPGVVVGVAVGRDKADVRRVARW